MGKHDYYRRYAEKKAQRDQRRAGSWKAKARDPLVWFTGVLAISTVGLVVVGWLQLDSLNKTDETQRSIQRAFVFPKRLTFGPFKESGQVVWRFFPVWENSGNSQTVNLRLFPYCGANPIDVNPPFETDYTNHLGAVRRVLGPKQATTGGRCNVTHELMQDVKVGSTFLYAGGQALYEDIFGGEHVTQFCYQYLGVDNDALSAYADAEAVLGIPILCWRHNCADDECKREERRPRNQP